MADDGAAGGAGGSEVREQDRYLPVANISRIMRRGMPSNGKVAKEAKETVQESVSEFISFITSEASDKCQQEKRKTINGDDLLWAMGTLGFERYIEPLRLYLIKYRETLKAQGASGAVDEDEDMPPQRGGAAGGGGGGAGGGAKAKPRGK